MPRKFQARALRKRMGAKDLSRFFASIHFVGLHWLWVGHKDRKGYGQFWFQGRAHWTHRVSYATFIGPIPTKLTVNHKRTCRNPSCVNPACLELLTNAANAKERWEIPE